MINNYLQANPSPQPPAIFNSSGASFYWLYTSHPPLGYAIALRKPDLSRNLEIPPDDAGTFAPGESDYISNIRITRPNRNNGILL